MKILYLFESKKYYLFEIKNEDIIDSDKSKIYNWILYNKEEESKIILDFINMKSNTRNFKQGVLVIDLLEAFFNYSGEKIYFRCLSDNAKNYKIVSDIIYKKNK